MWVCFILCHSAIQLLLWCHHSNPARRGTSTWLLKDKCHIYLRHITFTPQALHSQLVWNLKFVSFMCWQLLTLCKKTMQSRNPLFSRHVITLRHENLIHKIFFLSWQHSLKDLDKDFRKFTVKRDLCRNYPKCKRVDSEDKNVSCIFSHKSHSQTWSLPSSDHQLHKVKDHDCLHSPLIRTALSDQTPAGTRIMPFPPASTSYSHSNPTGTHAWAEVNHCSDQPLTTKKYLCTCEWLSEWKP